MCASHAVEIKAGWCVPKATLLAAVCRAAGIPARLGFADVRNHLSTERMRRNMETELFYWHGYTDIWLNGAWRKATPAFNLSLCQKAGVKPLEFDGSADSIFHEFDNQGRRHMEYVSDRGAYADVPREEMLHAFERLYPNYKTWMQHAASADFERDVRPDGAK